MKKWKTLYTFCNKKKLFYKAVSAGNFYSNNYIEYESNGDINKTLSIKEYLDKIKPFSKDIIISKNPIHENSVNHNNSVYFF